MKTIQYKEISPILRNWFDEHKDHKDRFLFTEDNIDCCLDELEYQVKRPLIHFGRMSRVVGQLIAGTVGTLGIVIQILVIIELINR